MSATRRTPGGLPDLFQHIIDHIQAQGLPPLSGDDARYALRRQRARTGLGADRLSPLDLLRLPQEAPEELAC
eukprot:3692202-Pyramimonas_sp.AAC.1